MLLPDRSTKLCCRPRRGSHWIRSKQNRASSRLKLRAQSSPARLRPGAVRGARAHARPPSQIPRNFVDDEPPAASPGRQAVRGPRGSAAPAGRRRLPPGRCDWWVDRCETAGWREPTTGETRRPTRHPPGGLRSQVRTGVRSRADGAAQTCSPGVRSVIACAVLGQPRLMVLECR